jgi:hypothetical protein
MLFMGCCGATPAGSMFGGSSMAVASECWVVLHGRQSVRDEVLV